MLDARHDFEDVSKLTKAEMARFDKEKVDDFKKALEEFADSLAVRQREVSEEFFSSARRRVSHGKLTTAVSTLTRTTDRSRLAALSRSPRQGRRS